jgi:hypothetical protein
MIENQHPAITRRVKLSRKDQADLLEACRAYRAPLRNPSRTTVPRVFIDAMLATQGTVEGIVREATASGNLMLAEKAQRLLSGGFRGLDPSVTELQVVMGLLALMASRGDAAEAGHIDISGRSELAQAMGMRKHRSRRGRIEPSGRELDQAAKAFVRLSQRSQKIVYRFYKGYDRKSKRGIFEVVVDEAPLYRLRRLAATGPNGRSGAIRVTPHPVMYLGVDSSYRLTPADPYHVIKDALPRGRRVEPYQIKFLYWLHRHKLGRQTVETNKESLAAGIGLVGLIRSRQRSRLERTISGLYRLGKRLGYILDYREGVPTQRGGRKDIITLNPSRIAHCAREARTRSTVSGAKTTLTPAKTTLNGAVAKSNIKQGK